MVGILLAGFLVVGALFLKFWTRTRDELFLAFSTAFALLALSQAAPPILGLAEECRAPTYANRLAAFVLIFGAIATKDIPWRDT